MRLYLDTNIISMWYDRKPHNREKKQDTRRLLLLCRRGFHQGHVSDIARIELQASREPYATRDLRLVVRLHLRTAEFDQEWYLRLFSEYRKEQDRSRLPEADLRHLAAYSASDLEGLVTYDLKHLGNQVRVDLVRTINHAQGTSKELRVGPPEAFLPPPPRG